MSIQGRWFLGLCLLLGGTIAQASSVKLSTTNVDTVEGIKIPQSAQLLAGAQGQEKTYDLMLTGYGLRIKKVGIFTAKVYVAASYAQVSNTRPKDPLEEVKKARGKVITLSLLRGLSADDLRSSFDNALRENQVPTTTGPIKKLLDQITFSLPVGTVVTLMGYDGENASNEVLEVQTPKANLKAEGEKLSYDFWKVWFGTSSDQQMLNLQKSLIKFLQ